MDRRSFLHLPATAAGMLTVTAPAQVIQPPPAPAIAPRASVVAADTQHHVALRFAQRVARAMQLPEGYYVGRPKNGTEDQWHWDHLEVNNTLRVEQHSVIELTADTAARVLSDELARRLKGDNVSFTNLVVTRRLPAVAPHKDLAVVHYSAEQACLMFRVIVQPEARFAHLTHITLDLMFSTRTPRDTSEVYVYGITGKPVAYHYA